MYKRERKKQRYLESRCIYRPRLSLCRSTAYRSIPSSPQLQPSPRGRPPSSSSTCRRVESSTAVALYQTVSRRSTTTAVAVGRVDAPSRLLRLGFGACFVSPFMTARVCHEAALTVTVSFFHFFLLTSNKCSTHSKPRPPPPSSKFCQCVSVSPLDLLDGRATPIG